MLINSSKVAVKSSCVLRLDKIVILSCALVYFFISFVFFRRFFFGARCIFFDVKIYISSE